MSFTGVACLEITVLQYIRLRWLASSILSWMPGFNPRQDLVEFVVENVALQVLWFYIFIIISPKLFIYCWQYVILAVDSVHKALKIQIFFYFFYMKHPCWCGKYNIYEYSQSQPTELILWYDLSNEKGNVRSLYRVGSLTAAARELTRYKLDLVGVQVCRTLGGTKGAW